MNFSYPYVNKGQHSLCARLVAIFIAVVLSSVSFAQAPIPAPAQTNNDPVTGTPYKADFDMKAVLVAQAKLGAKPIETLSVAQARRQPSIADAVKTVLAEQGVDTAPAKLIFGVKSADKMIPGPAGPLPVRIYTPRGKGPFPVIVYFHGGGWVLGDKQVYDASARGLSKGAQSVVVSVDYRLAPENKFPAAWDDALAAYKWVAMNAASLKGNPKSLALAGESAGGTLAISTAISAIAAGITIPNAILAIYPLAQTSNMATDSYIDCAVAKPLDKAMIAWFLDNLLTTPADKSDPRLDLVHASLSALPRVIIIHAQIDPLRSDSVLLEQALHQAGVRVTRKEYAGVTHEFFGTAAVVRTAKEAQAFAGEELQRSISH